MGDVEEKTHPYSVLEVLAVCFCKVGHFFWLNRSEMSEPFSRCCMDCYHGVDIGLYREYLDIRVGDFGEFRAAIPFCHLICT